MSRSPYTLLDTAVAPGKQALIEIPVARSVAGQMQMLPVHVFHGKSDGPVLAISAAIHGDEISGVEIARRLARKVKASKLAGTLLIVPVVNLFGFVAGSRYLPDRRDLNRSFPGREQGPLASRLAYLFRTEVLERADFAIDLHSAAIHRYNLPQIRVSPDAKRAVELARAFSPPIVIHSPLRENSLRALAMEAGVEMLLYEAGEALRLDSFSTRIGVNGILRTMEAMGMLELKPRKRSILPPLEATRSMWVRAPRAGMVALRVASGSRVERNELLGKIADPVRSDESAILSPISGLVIGDSRHGVANRGDALLHIAQLGEDEGELDPETEERLSGVMLDEHEIV
ncbi:succinylglutamate desuccinylase/aspartoacylase family protein [Sphingomicrobium marinum]|uniref:succinylglutamate desuccinylase/aspartoacylase family protein n=1 Tax=Sphingomicrobium marinum TaxID=1227950 RepID=UPI00223FCEAE|nr:succinylglutamate desuccinylase/aspartoacylase family protein [Sphingomicrobium marinum]